MQCADHICIGACAAGDMQPFLAHFPHHLSFLMYLLIFREKGRAGEILLFVRKLKHGIMSPFPSLYVGLLVEQRDALELLVPGCLYSCSTALQITSAANLRGSEVARVL